MQRLISGLSYGVAALAIAAGCGAAAVHAQSPAGEAPGAAPRTPWGAPDLQGIWVGSTLTPLERPPQFEGREFLREEEVAALENGAVARNVRLAERPAEATTAGGSVDRRAAARPASTTTCGSTAARLGPEPAHVAGCRPAGRPDSVYRHRA